MSATTSPAPQSTFAALRHSNFRLFIAGQVISLSGTWMQRVAQGWLVFQLTGSELWLGLVATAMGLPMFLLMPLGGVVADRVPRRRIIVFCQAGLAVLGLTLAVLTFTDVVAVWHIVLLALGMGFFNALEMPARQVMIVDILREEDLQGGLAIEGMTYDVANIVGPTLAGIILVQFGPEWAFFLDGITSVGNVGLLVLMSVIPFVAADKIPNPFTQLREGLAYAWRHPLIRPVLLLDTAIALLGINVLVTMLPAFADVSLNSPEVAYAAISAALGFGAIGAGVMNVRLSRWFGRGRVAFACSLAIPVVMFLFGTLHIIPVSVGLMALLGFGFATFFVTSNMIIQTNVEPAYRGRVMSLFMLALWGLPLVTTLAFGLLAEALTAAGAFAVCAVVLLLVSFAIARRSGYVAASQPQVMPIHSQ
jgi:MFS family permease